MTCETLQTLVWWGLAWWGVTAVAVSLIIADICAKHRLELDDLRKHLEQKDYTISHQNDMIVKTNAERARLEGQRREVLGILEADE